LHHCKRVYNKAYTGDLLKGENGRSTEGAELRSLNHKRENGRRISGYASKVEVQSVMGKSKGEIIKKNKRLEEGGVEADAEQK